MALRKYYITEKWENSYLKLENKTNVEFVILNKHCEILFFKKIHTTV